MKKFVKILLIIIAIVAVALVVLSFMGAKEFRMSRNIYINASKATVWENINLWEKQKTWSPWVAREPDMKITIEGTDGTVGSKYSWESETQGSGNQVITVSKPSDLRTVQMDFGMGGKPFSDFKLKDSASGTFVEWTMYGENGFLGRVMANFIDFEKFVGPDYEAGLKNLKKVSEASTTP